MYIVSIKKLGIPQNSRDAFEVLNSNGIIDDSMSSVLVSDTNLSITKPPNFTSRDRP